MSESRGREKHAKKKKKNWLGAAEVYSLYAFAFGCLSLAKLSFMEEEKEEDGGEGGGGRWRRRRRRTRCPSPCPQHVPGLIPGIYKDKLPWSSVKTKGERTHAVTPDIEAGCFPPSSLQRGDVKQKFVWPHCQHL